MDVPNLKGQSMEWKHTDSPIKKKFQAQWSVKEVMLTVFWCMKEPITIDFLEKDATYCPFLRQNLPDALNNLHVIFFFFLDELVLKINIKDEIKIILKRGPKAVWP